MSALKLESLSAVKSVAFESPTSQSELIAQLRSVIRTLSDNIRELENAIERANPFSSGNANDGFSLPGELLAEDEVATIGFEKGVADMAAASLQGTQALAMYTCDDGRWPTAAEIEREHIVRTLQHAADNQSVAARLLDIDRHQLRRRMQEYGLMQPGQARRGRPLSANAMPRKKAA